MLNTISQGIHKVGTELGNILQDYNIQNNEETASVIGSHSVAILDDPAFTDGIKRRQEVYKAIYEMAKEQYDRFGNDLLKAVVQAAVLAGPVYYEIAETCKAYLCESELIRDFENVKKDVEYVYH